MPVVNSSSQSETVFGAKQLAVIRQYLSSVDTGSVSALAEAPEPNKCGTVS